MKIRWGSYPQTVNGSISMTNGITPSSSTLNISPSAVALSETADLYIDDDRGGSITLQDCHLFTANSPHGTTGIGSSITVLDFRWKWSRAEPVSGEYNRRDADGKIVGDKQTAQDLASLLLDNLQIPGGSYSVAGLPTDQYPFKKWDYALPAEELHALCLEFGCVICPQLDGTVSIFASGVSETEVNVARASTEPIQRTVDKPGNAVFVGKENLYQVEITIEAVGFNPTDGQYYIVDGSSLTYKPAGGWFPAFEDSIADETDQKAARETIFKYYRLPETITLDRVYDREEFVALWSEGLVEFETVDSESRRAKPYAKGRHATEAHYNDPNALTTDTSAVVPVEFVFDPKTACIIFRKPVFDVEIELREGADLTLVAAFRGATYTKPFIIDDGIEDLFERVKATDTGYDYLLGVLQNREITDQAASDHVSNAFKKYDIGTVTDVTNEYPGFQEINLDGAISMISWSGGAQEAPTTSVSWGEENNPFGIPMKVRNAQIDSGRLVIALRDKDRSNK